MPTSSTPQVTDFSRDVVGRYVCNGLDEALRSTDRSLQRSDQRPQIEAREFDFIVLGGGTFGAVLAEHLAFRDRAREHRILVLEAGPLVLGEHVQNLPVLGLNVPSATSIAQLRAEDNFGLDKPRNEVWGLPWHSPVPFTGLAYAIGGRSLYWGGWSPELIDSELPSSSWPSSVVTDLKTSPLPSGARGYFQEASEQIGVSETNDFVFGELHRALRKQVFQALKVGGVSGAIPSSSLPDHPALRFATATPDLAELLGLPPGETIPPGQESEAKNELKLEAPLAVQGRAGHAGFFPFNKFSSVPLLVKAARESAAESAGDDARRQIMIVPRCHVIRVESTREGGRLRATAVVTNQGTVPLSTTGKLIFALGTVESTRLVLNWLGRAAPDLGPGAVGRNLMAHLRSNLDLRIPRENLKQLKSTVKGLQASALLVKGAHEFGDGGKGHYHLQITASGLGARGGNSEAELFKKIPDIDTFNAHRNANDTHVVVTVRGIGEMQPQNPLSFIGQDTELDEFGEARAFVSIADPRDAAVRAASSESAKDFELWGVMDQAAKDLARALGVVQPPEPARDGLGTTHHETGTLAMGEDATVFPASSQGLLHNTINAYVAGPAAFPTIGSPNPMLTGVALCRRMGDALATSQPYIAPDGFEVLFNGFDTSAWRMTTIRNQPKGRDNPGSMRVWNGALETVPGNDMGIFWCTRKMPNNFILRLEWLRWAHGANSGVYLRFPDPESKGYDNTAYVAVDFGFEVQIDELGDIPVHRTGAIYRQDNRTDGETLTQRPARPPGEWNEYELRVEGQMYTAKLNGQTVCVFDNTGLYSQRGQTSVPTYVGLQVYPVASALVGFRRIRFQAL